MHEQAVFAEKQTIAVDYDLPAQPEKVWYSWRGGDKTDDGGYELDSVITWKLEPGEDGGTRLSLRRSGFDAGSFDFQILSQGWRGKVAAQLMRVLGE